MEYLKLKRVTAEEARKNSSLGLVYLCPKCKVGHALVHATSNTVKCGICKGIYKKP